MSLTVRPFEQSDLARLHEIRVDAYKPVFASFRSLVGARIAKFSLPNAEAEQGSYLDQCCNPDTPQEVHVVERDGQIVGFVTTLSDQNTKLGVVDLNAVDPAAQGGGIGTWMYKWALDHLASQGMKAAEVGTGGDASHAPARRAYEKAGFGPSIPNVYYYTALGED